MKNNIWKQKEIYLVSANSDYLILTYRTPFGERADIVDYQFFKVSTNLTVEYAKRKIKQLEK